MRWFAALAAAAAVIGVAAAPMGADPFNPPAASASVRLPLRGLSDGAGPIALPRYAPASRPLPRGEDVFAIGPERLAAAGLDRPTAFTAVFHRMPGQTFAVQAWSVSAHGAPTLRLDPADPALADEQPLALMRIVEVAPGPVTAAAVAVDAEGAPSPGYGVVFAGAALTFRGEPERHDSFGVVCTSVLRGPAGVQRFPDLYPASAPARLSPTGEGYVCPAPPMRIAFAGDLDRDGRLDLILEPRSEPGGVVRELYLSSRAGPGELMGFVASDRTTGR